MYPVWRLKHCVNLTPCYFDIRRVLLGVSTEADNDIKEEKTIHMHLHWLHDCGT